MRTKIKLRPAKLTDCAACQRLGRVPEIAIAPGWYLPLEYYRKIIAGKHIFMVAEVNQKIVGFIIGEKIVAGYLSQYVVVNPKFRRRGIGRALLEALEKTATRRGAYFLLAYGEMKSPGIQSLHRRLGWQSSHVAREWSKGLTPNPRSGGLGAPKK